MLFRSVQFSRSAVSDFWQPHESQHARPPCPSPTPGVHRSEERRVGKECSHQEERPDGSLEGETAVRYKEELPGSDSEQETMGKYQESHGRVIADSLKWDRKIS